jgi:hypothetical protein
LTLAVFVSAASASGLPRASHAHKPAPGTATRFARVQLAARVQLGSWRTALEAANGWNHIERRAGGAMRGLSPRVVHGTLPGRGSFYRLWVGPVDRAGVASFCASLHAKHIECILAPG